MTEVLRQAFAAYGGPLGELRTTFDAPRESEVIVRVGHCGVCHSDLHLHDGYFDLGGGRKLDVTADRQLPFTLGHEIEGTIEAAGPDAGDVQPGRRVVIYPWIGCGRCATCARGDEHLCAHPRAIGIQIDGGYATHVRVPHPKYLFDYEPIPPALAGPYMCSGLTAFSAVEKVSKWAERSPVLIIGLGGVGLMALAFLQAKTGSSALVAEIDPAKRALALERGATQAFDPADADARKAILAATGGVGAVIDFVGSEQSVKLALGSLTRGGQVIVVGLIGGELKLPLPSLPLRGIAIEGSYVGSLAEAGAMLTRVRAGGIQPIPVTVRPLSEAQMALDDLRSGRAMGRIVLAAHSSRSARPAGRQSGGQGNS